MPNKVPRVVLDTNILVSAYVFGGKPEQILKYVIQAKVEVVTSLILISELIDILRKKFHVSSSDLKELEEEIKDLFEVVYPSYQVTVVRDEDDNRVLEAALEGRVDHVISGDYDLLNLKKFRDISILSATDFLQALNKGTL